MRKVTLFIIVSLWLLLPGAYAQKASKKNLVNYEELGLQSISKQSVEAQLSFLASDALQGRQTGKQGGLAAGEYIQALLKEWGVKPYYNSYFQPFEAYSPAREKGVEFEVRPDSIAKYKQERAYRRLNLRNVIGII
ncbi:MAG: hypothetical protein LBO74_10045 [Candidatus Symbiothrix sp.]|jgi:hypothetical protein|nr:hypothetical protein [Candidatus Symbiothrix sp.]